MRGFKKLLVWWLCPKLICPGPLTWAYCSATQHSVRCVTTKEICDRENFTYLANLKFCEGSRFVTTDIYFVCYSVIFMILSSPYYWSRANSLFVLPQLHPFKWPQVVIFMPQGLPRGPTGKFQRIDFAKRAQLPTLRDDSNNDGNVNSHDKTEASYISSTNRANAEITTESTAFFEANYPSVNGISSGGLSSSSSGSLSSLSNIKCFPIR